MPTEKQPLTLSSYPSAILHVDADAFFTSVEQSVHPELKGRPVVTGKERGIIACASYEAKAIGIRRGVALWDARRMCRELVVLPSDYETYSIYSKRMFDIMRRYTPTVQEHSVDEGFADLSGLRRMYRTSYEEIAKRMQRDICGELDITVSVGLSPTKSLSKLASDFEKPHGFTPVPGHQIHEFLQKLDLSDVWGFGPNTVNLLHKHGLRTPFDFISRPEKWAGKMLGKIGLEIWNELRGKSMYPVSPEEKITYASISKCKTFTSPSSDRDFVYAKLIRNVESAFIKLRRYNLQAREIYIGLRHQDFTQEGLEARLNRATSITQEIVPLVRNIFEQLYREGIEYRCTLIVLSRLEPLRNEQFELFEDRVKIEKLFRASRVIDEVNEQFGKHKLSLGTSLFLPNHKITERDDQPWRKGKLLKGETARKRLNLPRLSIDV
ncbi:MAG: DNA polymerase IV [Verrucomicrobia bacterium]|nr:DNA polymerase IV [Verrucomicrobiota bacterium]